MEYGTLSLFLFLFRARTLQCYTELSAHTTQFSNRRSSLLICLPPLSLKSQYALRMLLTELRNLHCAHNSRTSTSDFSCYFLVSTAPEHVFPCIFAGAALRCRGIVRKKKWVTPETRLRQRFAVT